MAAPWMSTRGAPASGGLSSLFRGRRNQVLAARGLPPSRQGMQPVPRKRPWPPPGGQTGGYVEGYQGGGGVMGDYTGEARRPTPPTPAEEYAYQQARARAAARAKARARAGAVRQARRGALPTDIPRGWQEGGPVGYQGGGRTMNPRAAGAAAMLRNRPSPIPRRPLGPSVPPMPENYPLPPPGGWQLGGEVGVAPEEVAMASEIFARATPEQQAQITGGGGGPGMMDEEAAIGEALAMAMGGGGGGPPMGGPPMNGAPPMGGLI